MFALLSRSLAVAAVLGLAGTAHADDPMYTCHEPPAQTKITVAFKPNTSLHDLAAWATSFSCKNIVFSADAERAAQGITIVAPKPLTPKQAMQLFVDSLSTVGLVVTVKGDTITIKLGPKAVARCDAAPGVTTGTTSAPPPTRTAAQKADDDQPDALLAKGIRTIDASHYAISAALRDAVLADPMRFMKGARVMPPTASSKTGGFQLSSIRPGSIYAKLGFVNGDTLQSVNGHELTSADNALDAYAAARDAKVFEVVVVRKGAKVTLSYTIEP